MKKLSTILILIFLFSHFKATAEEREIYELHIKDHKFIPEILHVTTNKKIKLIVYNDDNSVEEFESIDLSREKIIPPHAKISLLIGPLEKGKYKFFGDFHQDSAQGIIVSE
jgi:hypothetical protein